MRKLRREVTQEEVEKFKLRDVTFEPVFLEDPAFNAIKKFLGW